MAYEHANLVLPGLRADSNGLATSQFLIGKIATTAGQVVLGGAMTTTSIITTIYGVIGNAPAANEEVEFIVSGVAKVKTCSTAIAIGDWVASNSTSQAIKTTTDEVGAIGRALEASSAVNDIISVLLIPGNVRF